MKVPTPLASIEGLLVFLAIVVLSAVSNWIKQRNELERQKQRRNLAGQQPVPELKPTEQPSPPQIDWREQLRRLLEGEPAEPDSIPAPQARTTATESAPKPAPPPPPPPFVSPPIRQEPSRPQPVVPQAVRPPASQRPSPAADLPRIPPASAGVKPTVAPSETSSGLARLETSATVYKRASELTAETATRLEHLARLPGLSGRRRAVPGHQPAAREKTQVFGLLKTPRSARQALLASVILGRPRALEETPDGWWAKP